MPSGHTSLRSVFSILLIVASLLCCVYVNYGYRPSACYASTCHKPVPAAAPSQAEYDEDEEGSFLMPDVEFIRRFIEKGVDRINSINAFVF
jgi:hypothetical protein